MATALRTLTLALAFGLLCLAPGSGRAALPDRYGALVIQPSGPPERQEFDLTPAFARAAREHKRVYMYLGASDCPFCRKYEAFLAQHADELLPHFAKDWLVVDLRSRLSNQASRLWFRIGERSLSYVDFMKSLNDERQRQLVYPSVWLFDAQVRPLMPMPAGTGTFETVPEQLEILRLEQ